MDVYSGIYRIINYSTDKEFEMVKAFFIGNIIFFILLIPCVYLFKKYKNPYKLIMVFGKKGSGKTTFLTKTAYYYIRKGRPVYSTVYVPGAYLFDVNEIGKKICTGYIYSRINWPALPDIIISSFG